ncbi:MAG: hypothetical protein ABIJ08_01560 [Nanoarchaeota archaeon]
MVEEDKRSSDLLSMIVGRFAYDLAFPIRDILDRKKDDAHFYEAVKKEFGLVREKGESRTAFEKRVYETVYDKDTVQDNLLFRKLKDDIRLKHQNTREVQAIIERYLGIKNAPIDAFEADFGNEQARGCAWHDEDGSAIIITHDMPDNTSRIVRNLSRDLSTLLSGEKVDSESGNYTHVCYRAGLDQENSLDNMYINMLPELFKNETFIKIHEGIHALHMNNHKSGRRKKVRNGNAYIKELLPFMIPLLGSVFRSKRFGFTVETECLAYKVGLDTYVSELIDKAVEQLGSRYSIPADEGGVSALKMEFFKRNSAMAKAIVRTKYLHDGKRGYGEASDNYGKALTNGFIGAMLLSTGSTTMHIIGLYMVARSANKAIKSPISYYFEGKIGRYVDVLDQLIDHHGGAGKAFYETLGMSFREMKKQL